MGGVAPPPEHRVRCLAPLTRSGGDEELRLRIDERTVGVKIRISQLSRQLVENLPDRTLDLLEIAALVYGADSAVSRGGETDQQMGHKWHRRFIVEISVRDLVFWQAGDVQDALEETLMFLSGDRFEFTFVQKKDPEAERSRFFDLGTDRAWQADRILMFSGGLDSFAGALEEIADHHQRVALVSHFSATKTGPIQRDLKQALEKRFGMECLKHVPVQVQMTKGGRKDGTHRSRSFLFAVLGAIAAQAFGRDRVSFHENGVVSLNLPPVSNVLGTRATRTTHPQTLARFSGFFGKVFDGGIRVDNPFFWRSKTDVSETITRLGMSDQIAHTRSCADVHNQTKQHVHCGRCSQCIDRRFAVLAAGAMGYDPEEAYKLDLLDGRREDVRDREIALSYVRNARAYEHMSPEHLVQTFPAVLDAVNYLDQPADTALTLITKLLNRHGASVASVMREALRNRDLESFPEASLPQLFGDEERRAALPGIPVPTPEISETSAQAMVLEIDEQRNLFRIDGKIDLGKSASSELLIELAKEWLEGAGQGLDPLDYPLVSVHALMRRIGVGSEETVRRRVNRARRLLMERFVSAGMSEDLAENMIENIPWHGYRLTPDLVTVRRMKGD